MQIRYLSIFLTILIVLGFIFFKPRFKDSEIEKKTIFVKEKEFIKEYEEIVKEISYFKDSATLYKKLRSLEQKAITSKTYEDLLLSHILFGDDDSFKSKYFNSNFQYFEALKYAQRLNSSYFMSKIYHGLAINHRQENKNEEAISYYRKAIINANQVRNFENYGSLFNDFGIAFFENKQIDSAIYYYKKALQVYKKQNYIIGEGVYFSNIGDVFFMQKKYKTALESFLKSKVFFSKLKHEGLNAQVELDISRTYLELYEYFKALNYAKNANQNAIKTKNLNLIYESEVLLSQIYSSLKKYKKSNSHLNRSLENLVAINNQDLNSKIQAAKNGYDFELQKIENNSQLENIEQKKRENLWLAFGLIIALVLVSLISFFLFDRTKKSRIIEFQKEELAGINSKLEEKVKERTIELSEVNKELVLKNFEITEALFKGQSMERKRVAAELHDNLGSTLSALKWRLGALNAENLSEKERLIYEGIKENMGIAYEEVRLISHSLMPYQFENYGFVNSINKFANEITDSRKIGVHTDFKDFLFIHNNNLLLEFYNITLELVNNALKHANASNIWIVYSSSSKHLHLMVKDDGSGLNKNKIGMGLKNINERLKFFNGNISLRNSKENIGVVALVKVDF
jgi:signal transduction histidine kinase